MCHQNTAARASVQEDTTGEESLLIYCKPVELYNLLQRRAQFHPSFLSRCLRYKIEAKRKTGLTDGSVIFNYRDQNTVLRKTEVTRDFACPFCLLLCSSFKGLRCHLIASHDLFKFEFWATDEYRAINVSVRLDFLRTEIASNGQDPREQLFCLCSKPRKRRRLEDPRDKAKYIHPMVMESDSSILATGSNNKSNLELNAGEEVPGSSHIDVDSPNSRFVGESHSQLETRTKHMEQDAANTNTGVPVARAQYSEDMECGQAPSPPCKGKTKKISERTDTKSGPLQKRQFFHSHRAQPMALEEVLSDRDSEDEVDDEIADLEDRRMLDDFVDVTKDEKRLMHLWNSFMRKQRVLADGHIPWAYEAFSRLHALELIQTPPLFWCWRLFMIKLWNHGLLDGGTMNNCNIILEQLRKLTSEDHNRQDGANPLG